MTPSVEIDERKIKMENESNESLKRNLDELIRLFKKVKDKSVFENIPGVNKAFFSNFEMLVNNYDMIKENLSEELLSQFGEPIHKMIANTVEQLKEQLGEAGELDEELPEFTESKNILITPEPENWEDEVKHIDEMLKRGNLKADEVDRLLDRRSELKSKNE